MEHHLSIEESIRFGWAKMRAHSTIVFQVIMTIFAVQIAGQLVTRVLGDTLDGKLASAALFILSVVLGVGFTRITLRIAEGKHAEYADIVPPVNVWIAYIGAVLLAAIVTMLPLLVAIAACLVAYAVLPYSAALVVISIVAAIGAVLTVYFALRYALVRFAILDDHDIINSLRSSAHLTRHHKWWLMGFLITVALLNLLGAILFLVGLLVTVPVTMFAFAHVYLKLNGRHS